MKIDGMTHLHYCNEERCWATLPCPIHDKRTPVNGFKLLVNPIQVKPRQKKVDVMTVVNVLYLPCSHTYEVPIEMLPEERRTKKFNIECQECPAQYFMEVTTSFIEFTRID